MASQIVGGRFAFNTENPRRGGTANVYKASDLENPGTVVAVKVFEAANIEEDLIRELFLRETEALRALKHPNVVAMIDSGYEEKLGKYYVVLEWLDETLRHHLAKIPEDADFGWDTLTEDFLIPVLRGLAFAHERNILHRDIKPANVLMSDDGTPKIADFGIAKIVTSLRLGLTVADFASHPYSPPERATSWTPRGDLFSFGMMALWCLVPRDFAITHDNLEEAIEEANLPPGAEKYVRRLVAIDPDDRPFTGAAALAELERLQQRRPPKESKTYHLFLPRSTCNKLASLFEVVDEQQVYQKVVADLNGAAVIMPRASQGDNTSAIYYLMGQELSYAVKVDEDSQAKLVIVGFTQLPPWRHEQDRDRSCPIAGRFSFSAVSAISQAKGALSELERKVADFVLDQQQQEREGAERRLFRTWEDMLQAQTDLSQSQQSRIGYDGIHVDGQRVTFDLLDEVATGSIGQVRRVDMREQIVGDVIEATGTSLTLDLMRGNAARIPRSGDLVIDQTASEASLSKQRRALQRVQDGTSVRSDLRPLLLHPEDAATPSSEAPIEPLYQDRLDEPKRAALSAALHCPDFTVVQGPPGTGKTTWIAEFVCQYLDRHPGKRVLLCAQTHTAVDNAIERISDLWPNPKMVRLGAAERISATTEEYRVENQLEVWSSGVRDASMGFLRQWAHEHGIHESFLTLRDQTEELRKLHTSDEDLSREAKALESQATADEPMPDPSRYPTVFHDLFLTEEAAKRSTVTAAAQTYIELSRGLQRQWQSAAQTENPGALRADLQRVIAASVGPQSGMGAGESLTESDIEDTAAQVIHLADATDAMVSGWAWAIGNADVATTLEEYTSVGLALEDVLRREAQLATAEEVATRLLQLGTQLGETATRIREVRKQIAAALSRTDLADAQLTVVEQAVDSLLAQVPQETVIQFRRMRDIQAEWLQRFGKGEGFEGALIARSDIVAGTCVGVGQLGRNDDVAFDVVVLDEASKATPMEALIPVTLGRQWVLVGDNRQLPPFVEDALQSDGLLERYGLKQSDLVRTLFDHLAEKLPEQCRPRLAVQHRMVPPIGDLISECFYEGGLESARPRGESHLVDGLLRRRVTWLTTSETRHRREQSAGRSFFNLTEVDAVHSWLKLLNAKAMEANLKLTVGIISGYTAQKDQLTLRITPADKELWPALDIDINSVDAFQGREVDVVVYSVTRSNESGKLGFLRSNPRLNVALSRGREALLIVGDDQHCRRDASITNPFQKVVRYIERNTADCFIGKVNVP